MFEKIYSSPYPVSPSNFKKEQKDAQTKLLKTVVEFLNQASLSFHMSNKRSLATAAKDLAKQLKNKFFVGQKNE